VGYNLITDPIDEASSSSICSLGTGIQASTSSGGISLPHTALQQTYFSGEGDAWEGSLQRTVAPYVQLEMAELESSWADQTGMSHLGCRECLGSCITSGPRHVGTSNAEGSVESDDSSWDQSAKTLFLVSGSSGRSHGATGLAWYIPDPMNGASPPLRDSRVLICDPIPANLALRAPQVASDQRFASEGLFGWPHTSSPPRDSWFDAL